MAKIATYAAVAISIAAAIPSGGTSLLGTAALSAGLTASAATATLIASGVALAANLGANLLAKKPSVSGGTQSDWSADPNASVPIVLGRTGVGGNIVYRKGSGDADKNKYQSITTVLSVGPIASYDGLLCDRKPVTFNGAVASGTYFERLWMVKQLGLTPEAAALNTGIGAKPGWTTAHKISGLAADQVTLLYDAKGKNTFTTEPQMLRLVHGVLCYDPRADSTYPGGSGPQRANNQATWQWSCNPFVVGLTWVLGWRQNGKRRAGVGLRPDQIDIGSFAEAANIADFNGWTMGGQATTGDDKWEVLKAILQAGGGEPIRDGAILSCIVQAPRVSIASIGAGDLIGKASVPRSRPRKERINGIIPKYRSEQHFWEQVSGTVSRISAFVTEDGGARTRELEYPFVQIEAGQDTDQATQLAGYDVELSRERMPISLPLKLRWIGYRTGDCISCSIAELGLTNVQLIIIKRSLDPATGSVTLTVRTEDPGKHARVFALTGQLPPVNAFQRPDLPSDYALEQAARAAHSLLTQTVAYPVTSDDDSIIIAAFRGTVDDGRIIDFPAGQIDGLASGTNWVVLWSPTGGYKAVASPAVDALASSDNIYIATYSTSSAGVYPGQETPPGGYVGGGGYACPVEDAQLLLANADRSGPGATIRAGDLEAGAWVWTKHETTGVWGAYRVTKTIVVQSDVVAIEGRPLTSPSHLWWTDAGWRKSETMGSATGQARVVAITVADAHTYVLLGDGGKWMLSHNKLAQQPDQ
jgi:hypothetical protein